MFDLLLFTICNLIGNFFDRANEANMYETKSRRLRWQKVVIGIEIDGIGNFEDLLRVVFIDEECGNLKVVINGGNLTININGRSQTFYERIDLQSVTNAVGKGISSISKWNIVYLFIYLFIYLIYYSFSITRRLH